MITFEGGGPEGGPVCMSCRCGHFEILGDSVTFVEIAAAVVAHATDHEAARDVDVTVVGDPETTPEGWGFPSNSRKAHYFVKGRSLCRRWGWFDAHGPLEPDEHRSPDDCAPCRRAVDKRPAPPAPDTGAGTGELRKL